MNYEVIQSNNKTSYDAITPIIPAELLIQLQAISIYCFQRWGMINVVQ